MYSDGTEMDKNHHGQNLPDKRPSDKTPGQKPPRTIETEFVQGGFAAASIPGRTRPPPRCREGGVVGGRRGVVGGRWCGGRVVKYCIISCPGSMLESGKF